MSNPQFETSKRRLFREASDLRANPLVNCNAVPLENDIFTWHANIVCDKWPNTFFHFTIHFPQDYPNSPPKVKNSTYIAHENVQGDYICLDMLLRGEKNSVSPWRGWSSDYKVSSLLLQLQEFLFDVDFPPAWSDTRAAKEAAKFTCPHCTHKPDEPFPQLPKKQLSWECSGQCHALYRLERCARVRVGPSNTSFPITECPGGLTILVKEIRGNRAKVILNHHGRALIPGCKNFETGWVSRVTNRGPLLTKLMDVKTGVYTTKRRCQIYHCQQSFRDWRILPIGKYTKNSIIDIGDVLPFHNVLYGVIKGTEKMVEMRNLNFIREFKYKRKKKKVLSDAKRKEKWKNPTPRERRRRRYWRNMHTAAKQCAKVAAAPRGTIESQVPLQPNTYHPTFMLWVPAYNPMGAPIPMPGGLPSPLPSPMHTSTPPPMCIPLTDGHDQIMNYATSSPTMPIGFPPFPLIPTMVPLAQPIPPHGVPPIDMSRERGHLMQSPTTEQQV